VVVRLEYVGVFGVYFCVGGFGGFGLELVIVLRYFICWVFIVNFVCFGFIGFGLVISFRRFYVKFGRLCGFMVTWLLIWYCLGFGDCFVLLVCF